jgi:hypothetical protein
MTIQALFLLQPSSLVWQNNSLILRIHVFHRHVFPSFVIDFSFFHCFYLHFLATRSVFGESTVRSTWSPRCCIFVRNQRFNYLSLLCRKSNKIQQKTNINYCILTPHYVFSICSYFSLLGYRSQQWLHQYYVTSFLVTSFNNNDVQHILAVVRKNYMFKLLWCMKFCES